MTAAKLAALAAVLLTMGCVQSYYVAEAGPLSEQDPYVLENTDLFLESPEIAELRQILHATYVNASSVGPVNCTGSDKAFLLFRLAGPPTSFIMNNTGCADVKRPVYDVYVFYGDALAYYKPDNNFLINSALIGRGEHVRSSFSFEPEFRRPGEYDVFVAVKSGGRVVGMDGFSFRI